MQWAFCIMSSDPKIPANAKKLWISSPTNPFVFGTVFLFSINPTK